MVLVPFSERVTCTNCNVMRSKRIELGTQVERFTGYLLTFENQAALLIFAEDDS